MNKKLNKVLDEIAKVENKIAVWQEHLEELYIKKNQLEDAEIIKSVRAMKLGSLEMLAFLEDLQSGTVPVRQEHPAMDTEQTGSVTEGTENYTASENGSEETAGYGNPEKEPGEAENNSGPGEAPAEREDKENEEKD